MHTYASLEQLLLATVQIHINPTATIVNYAQLSHNTSSPKMTVQRFEVHLSDGQSIILVVKPSPRIERLALKRLNQQRQPLVPLSHTLDLNGDGEALICMLNAGDEISPTHIHTYHQPLADGLAKIHLANMNQADDLWWLPKTDRAYFADFILGWTWRSAWERALEDANFVEQFSDYIPKVQASAKQFPDLMEQLYDDPSTRTLIHTDIYTGHILATDKPYLVDWGQSHYGSFYLDLPNCFETSDHAEIYRQALAQQGMHIPRDAFVQKYQMAGRFVGFRYMWYWLEEWRKHPADWNEQGLLYMLQKACGE